MVNSPDYEAAAGARATLASIVESSHDAIVGMMRDGVVSSWNPAAERLYGYPATEIIGHTAETVAPPQYRTEEATILRRIVAGEEVERYRTQRVCRDATVVAVSLTISAIVDGAGVIVGAAAASRRLNELQEARDRFEVRMAHLRAEAVDAADRFEVQADEVRDQAHDARNASRSVERERAQMQHAEDRFET